MSTRRVAALLLLAGLVAGCSNGAASSPPVSSPSPTPSLTPSSMLTLKPASFLGVRFLRPAGWSAHPEKSSAQAGTVTYVAPGRRGTLYVERNDCAACVDNGLVMHGRRNGEPDPSNALGSYFPTSHQDVNAFEVTFATKATKPYTARGRLVVTKSRDGLTGYVVAIVTLPAADSATTAQILASLRVG